MRFDCACLFWCIALASSAFSSDNASHEWPQWRGPLSTGVAPFADPPTTWSESQNVRWKTELPGRGHSSPVVWGERIFLTTAVAYGDAMPPPVGIRPGAHDNVATVNRQEYRVLALDRRDGKILWNTLVLKDIPHETAHQTASFASDSPVTDGTHIYAFFGSAGLFCLDMLGDVKWKVDFGKKHTLHGHGEGNSPALYSGTLLINWDHEGPSFIVALDKLTGKERWRTERDEVTSWSTPIVTAVDGRMQVIVSATHRIRAYDLETGQQVWECGGMSTNVVASPVAADGILYAGSSYEKRSMLAIKLDGAKGDITGTDHVLWTRNRDTPYVPSPLLYDGKLYFMKHYQPYLICITAKTGEPVYGPFKLPELFNIYASPVAAAGRIYITSREGLTIVLKSGATPEILATNTLEDVFSASPALVGKDLFLRGEKWLYCLSAP